jgi:hypothetical protein
MSDRLPTHQSDSPLDEIYRRLVAIHYPLAEAGCIDQELHTRTLQRLMELMNYIDDVTHAEQPAKT